MTADHPAGAGLSVAPRAAMDREVMLPRRSLSIGASGRGDGERRYKLVANIDRGGMGELFLAELHEPRSNPRYVVIKRLLADLLDDDKYVAMFVAEADVMSKLNHPNIVRVFDTPLIDGTQCLAMEYVRGRNVQQMLARCEDLKQKIPPQVTLRIMTQVLRGLEHAHNFRMADGKPLNLVHRDVTPGNVLVSFEGEAKLTDFGIAKHQMSAVSTTVGIVKGKARYLAPEQILGEQATPRSDIFSAAGVVVEMLTNKPVFDRGSVPKTLYAIVNGERDDLESVLGFRAPLLVQLLNRALSTDPRHRLQSAKELAEGLDAASRLLGKPIDRDGVGKYLRDLYRDVEDPLSAFDPAMLLSDSPTVHGYRSEEVAPASIASGPVAPDPADLKKTVPAPGPPVDLPPFVPPPAKPKEPIHDPDTAPNGRRSEDRRQAPRDAVVEGEPKPSAQALEAARQSAHSGIRAPPKLVRGTPVAPAGASGGNSGASVDEALAVLAWLQARKPEGAPTDAGGELATPAAVPPSADPLVGAATVIAKKVETRSSPELAASPKTRSQYPVIGAVAAPQAPRFPVPVMFAAGAASGIVLTLFVQAMLRWASPAPPPPAPPPVVAIAPVPVLADVVPADDANDGPEPYELEPIAEEEPPPEDAAESVAAVAVPPGEAATIDLLEPRGARLRLDGVWVKEKIPFRGLALRAGKHQVRIQKGKWKHDLAFAIEAGEKLDLTRRLKRRAGGR